MNAKYQLPKDGGLIKEAAPKDIVHRYEKIPTRVFESEYNGVQYVADIICRLVRHHRDNASARDIYEELPPFVLGLTTGHTPLGLYRELVKRYQRGEISFANVAVYSLDEFYPICSTEQQSRNYRIHDEFLKHIDIAPENIHIPDGSVPQSKISEYCYEYEKSIRKIDLMIIGMGEEGQIGFNEQALDGIGAAFVRRVDIRTVMFDPLCEDMQEGRAVFKFTRRTLDWFRQHYPEKAETLHEEAALTDSETDGLSLAFSVRKMRGNVPSIAAAYGICATMIVNAYQLVS